jgi:hypothetical protein
LNDRAQDNWEPLLAIADHAGGDWPQLARKAALKISGVEHEAVSLSTELLTDIQTAFYGRNIDRISTVDLLFELVKDEEAPWATYNRGKPMTPRQLAKRLGEYNIKPNSVRIGATTPKGFMRKDFDDVFARYLTPPPTASLTAATPQQSDERLYSPDGCDVSDNPQRCGDDSQTATLNPLEQNDCCPVADTDLHNWAEGAM